jgi:Glycosyltransferase (GlcNAc)
MQFTKDWDIILIEELTNCNSTKPILSVYPPDFKSKPVNLVMCSNGFNTLGVPLFRARSVKPFKRPI